MPLYEFQCADCGVFEGARPMSRAHAPAACPSCGRRAPRVLSAVAIGQRAPRPPDATQPRLRKASGLARAGGRSSAPHPGGHRPWMIGH
jgi:putative FmdB family regulatory protein